VQRQTTRSATRALDRKFDFSSIVVKEAPSGIVIPHPMAAQVSAKAMTAGSRSFTLQP
jgi:hypothetical protein